MLLSKALQNRYMHTQVEILVCNHLATLMCPFLFKIHVMCVIK
jgi:hypothetical protein